MAYMLFSQSKKLNKQGVLIRVSGLENFLKKVIVGGGLLGNRE